MHLRDFVNPYANGRSVMLVAAAWLSARNPLLRTIGFGEQIELRYHRRRYTKETPYPCHPSSDVGMAFSLPDDGEPMMLTQETKDRIIAATRKYLTPSAGYKLTKGGAAVGGNQLS